MREVKIVVKSNGDSKDTTEKKEKSEKKDTFTTIVQQQSARSARWRGGLSVRLAPLPIVVLLRHVHEASQDLPDFVRNETLATLPSNQTHRGDDPISKGLWGDRYEQPMQHRHFIHAYREPGWIERQGRW
jgi:hypothetical protein